MTTHGMTLFDAVLLLIAGAALGWVLRSWREHVAPGHSRSKPITERRVQRFVGGRTHEIPATPGGYRGLGVSRARVRL